MKTLKLNTLLAAFIVLAVITFVAIACPALFTNILKDLISKN
jgi:hypothetical protein